MSEDRVARLEATELLDVMAHIMGALIESRATELRLAEALSALIRGESDEALKRLERYLSRAEASDVSGGATAGAYEAIVAVAKKFQERRDLG